MAEKTAIVLGASSGVGNVIVRTFALSNPKRFVYGFHRGHHQTEADKLEADYDNVGLFTKDAGTMFSDVVECVDALEARCDKQSIDVVVHSISGATVGSAMSASALDVEKTFNRLAHSYLWWVQRLMKTQLLAPACTFVALTNPCPTHYLTNTGVIGAAKAALEGYVTLLGCELGRFAQGRHRAVGLRFSTVITPALEKVMPSAIHGLMKLHSFIQPQGRMQTASDIANLVYAITRPEASWINATVVDATGGAPAMLMDYAFRSAATP